MNHCEDLERELAYLEREVSEIDITSDRINDEIPELIILENMDLITKKSAESETGGKVGTNGDININLINDKTGVSVERAAENLVSDYPVLDADFARNEIIEILKTGKKNYREMILGEVKEKRRTADSKRKEFTAICLGDLRANEMSEMARMINEMRRGEVRDLKKSEVIKAAQYFNGLRGEKSAEMDALRDSKKRLSPNSVNLFRWMKSPGQFDLIGIDTDVANDPTADLKISREVFWSRMGMKAKRKPKAKPAAVKSKPKSKEELGMEKLIANAKKLGITLIK